MMPTHLARAMCPYAYMRPEAEELSSSEDSAILLNYTFCHERSDIRDV